MKVALITTKSDPVRMSQVNSIADGFRERGHEVKVVVDDAGQELTWSGLAHDGYRVVSF